MVEHAPEERGVVSSILTFGTMERFTSFFTERFNTIQNYLLTQSFPTQEWLDLFKWNFWVEDGLGTTSEFSLISFGLVLLCVIGLLVFRSRLARFQKKAPVYEPIINQLTSLIVFIITMAVTYGFARAQAIAYLSSRITLLVTVIVSVVWLTILLFILLKKIPSTKRAYLEKERFFRYLPKR